MAGRSGSVIQIDYTDVSREIKKLKKKMTRGAKRKIITKSAKPVTEAIKSEITNYKGPPQKYPLRPYYKGGKIHTYIKSGNLKQSIGKLKLKKADLYYVGPRILKPMPGGSKADPVGRTKGKSSGYYAHMAHYNLYAGKVRRARKNVDFLVKGVRKSGQRAIDLMLQGIKSLYQI